MPWIRTLAVMFTLFSTAALAQPVIMDGKEWLQPADFVNLSWDEVAIVCDPVTGACDGMLNNIDVTGYTWASVADVNGLFNAYGVTPPLAAPGLRLTAGSSWAPSLLVDFDFTDTTATFELVWGWARTLEGDGDAYCPYVVDDSREGVSDVAISDYSLELSFNENSLGIWIFRPISYAEAAPVPTVPTYGLIFTVLGLLAIATRRLSRRNAREG